jgi:lipopolysaccharide export system permease protein
MIIFRAVFAELFPPFLLSLFIMSALLVLEKVYKLISLVVENRLRTQELGLMLVYLLPQILMVTLPLAVVGAVSITVIRHSVDSELITLRASGRSLWNYARPYFAFGLVATLITASFTLWIQPIAYRKYSDLQLEMIRYRAEEKIIPGEFNYDFGDKVIRVGGRLSPREFSSIFISDKVLRPNSPVIAAQHGTIEVDQEAKRVLFRLERGRIYTTDPDPELIRTVDFDRLNYRLDFQPSDSVETNLVWGLTTLELIQEQRTASEGTRLLRHFLELYSRFTIPVACLAFAIAALPMSILDPRSGRAGSFLRAIFLVVSYYLVWIGFKDLAYGRNASPHVMWIPPLLIALYGLLRLWMVNADIGTLRQIFRRA